MMMCQDNKLPCDWNGASSAFYIWLNPKTRLARVSPPPLYLVVVLGFASFLMPRTLSPWPCPCPVIFECALFFLSVRRAPSQALLEKDSVALSNLDPRDHSSHVIKINCKARSQMSCAFNVDTHWTDTCSGLLAVCPAKLVPQLFMN